MASKCLVPNNHLQNTWGTRVELFTHSYVQLLCLTYLKTLRTNWETSLRSLQANTAITLPSFFPRGVVCAFMSFSRVLSRCLHSKIQAYLKGLFPYKPEMLGDKFLWFRSWMNKQIFRLFSNLLLLWLQNSPWLTSYYVHYVLRYLFISTSFTFGLNSSVSLYLLQFQKNSGKCACLLLFFFI